MFSAVIGAGVTGLAVLRKQNPSTGVIVTGPSSDSSSWFTSIVTPENLERMAKHASTIEGATEVYKYAIIGVAVMGAIGYTGVLYNHIFPRPPAGIEELGKALSGFKEELRTFNTALVSGAQVPQAQVPQTQVTQAQVPQAQATQVQPAQPPVEPSVEPSVESLPEYRGMASSAYEAFQQMATLASSMGSKASFSVDIPVLQARAPVQPTAPNQPDLVRFSPSAQVEPLQAPLASVLNLPHHQFQVSVRKLTGKEEKLEANHVITRILCRNCAGMRKV